MAQVKNINDIRSIGFLHCADGSVALTPVFHGEMFATRVKVSREEFQAIRGDHELMKTKALSILNQETH